MIIQICSTWGVSPLILPYITKLEGVVSLQYLWWEVGSVTT